MQTCRHLFLDLEDTIITPVMDGWFNTHLINVEKIKRIMADFNPDRLHLFSFAVWNEEDLKQFNLGTRPMIENALGRQFDSTWTVDDDILPACLEIRKMAPGVVDSSKMSAFWGKHETFRLNMRHRHRVTWKNLQIETEVMLLDDAVWDESWEWPDLHVKGRIININNFQ